MDILAGEKLPLVNQLFNGDVTKFVRAILTDETGNPLGASPVSLTHLALGNYQDFTVSMPVGVAYVVAQYRVFDDALFTVPSTDQSIGCDVFKRLTNIGSVSTTVIDAQDIVMTIDQVD